jgi:hypothetical protein
MAAANGACMRGGEDEFMKLPATFSLAISTASSATRSSPAEDFPLPFKFTLQLTFYADTRYTPSHTEHKPFYAEYSQPLFDHPVDIFSNGAHAGKVLRALEWTLPWEQLAKFLETVPRGVMMSQGLNIIGGQKLGAGSSE